MTLTSIINIMTDVVTKSVPWLLVLLIFYWNISKLIFEADNAEKRKQAIPRLVWSIVALTILFSLGGLINLLSNTLLGQGNPTFGSAPSTQTVTPSPGAAGTAGAGSTVAPTSPAGSGTPAPAGGSGFVRTPPTTNDPIERPFNPFTRQGGPTNI